MNCWKSNNRYGKGKETTESPVSKLYSTYQGISWEFEIDTGAKYRFTLEAVTMDSVGGEVQIMVQLLDK